MKFEAINSLNSHTRFNNSEDLIVLYGLRNCFFSPNLRSFRYTVCRSSVRKVTHDNKNKQRDAPINLFLSQTIFRDDT